MLFSEFAGQENIKKYLVKSIEDNTVSHGYIFEGADETSTFEIAKIFAQSLLCQNFDKEPCNVCSSCVKFNSSNHPDLHIIEPTDKSIKRDEVDELIESINIKPFESDKKVYIIKSSEDMTVSAANTFLKTLEEPLGHTVIIMLTQNSKLLLPTITSRGQILTFRGMEKEELINILINKYNLGSDRAKLIANYSNCIIKKAEDIISGDDNTLEKRTEVFGLYKDILTLDKNIVFKYDKYFDDNKENIENIVNILIILLRDIYFLKYDIQDLIINNDSMDILENYLDKTDTNMINENIQYLQKVLNDVKNNINYKLIIDNMLLKLQKGVNK